MKNADSNKPDIFHFTDYRVFIKSLFDFQKSKSEFSFSIFADRAGFRARSFLRLVIAGKRNLSPDAISKVIVGFGMAFGEGEAFKSLVHFNQASDFKSRQSYWEAFLKMRPRNHDSCRVSDEYLYLARMAYPILLILLRQPHIDKSREALAEMTGLKISEVEEGLNTLVKLGTLKKLDNSFVVTSSGFRTSDDIPNIAVQTFHMNMLEKAKSTVSLDPGQREYQSMMVPLNREEFLYLRGRIRALVDEVDQKFGGRRPNSECAYALNLNLIPITPEFIRAESKVASQKSGEEEQTQEVFP